MLDEALRQPLLGRGVHPDDLAGLGVAVFGLGEAGSAIAADLAAAGAEVSGYDPADVADVAGIRRVVDPRDAVNDAALVMAITAAVDAMQALDQAFDALPAAAIYADLSTASPRRKQQLAARARERELAFVDVALMSTVPGKGLWTPALASGPGATAYVALLDRAGVPVEAVGPEAGGAATRKLLRSIVMKGLAGLVIESMRAANVAGLEAETWANLVGQFGEMDEAFLRRLVTGTAAHGERRLHEMQAAAELLDELGVEPIMTRGTVENLRRIPDEGLPSLPETPS